MAARRCSSFTGEQLVPSYSMQRTVGGLSHSLARRLHLAFTKKTPNVAFVPSPPLEYFFTPHNPTETAVIFFFFRTVFAFFHAVPSSPWSVGCHVCSGCSPACPRSDG
jgi:hypothetical protein